MRALTRSGLTVTPPPLSKQIKLPEKELGGALFERGYHEVRLTGLGSELLGPARDILRQVDEFKATAYAPSDLLARLEDAVSRLPTPVDFGVPGSAAEVTTKLVAGKIDLGLIHLPPTSGCATG